MSMESGGLPCGQGDLEANSDLLGTDNGMDLTKEMDTAKDLMLLELSNSLQKANEPLVRQESAQKTDTGKPIQGDSLKVNEGASTSGNQEKGTSSTGKKML
nr:PREDICTED: uncharacterized protein LOC106706634 [Latimeria chalumnae]|eukprot:XP_014353326.1 PREDICTED: uncharacterized protein LOC106706634 [Latimeria chalumnae]